MISYEQFGKLRLKKFTHQTDEIERVEDWEFHDQIWVGETLCFTEFLRLESDPKVVRSIAIDFSDFTDEEKTKLLHKLELPVQHGMSLEELTSALGKPTGQRSYSSATDRSTYEFQLVGPVPYNLSCTVTDTDGLIYLVMMRP